MERLTQQQQVKNDSLAPALRPGPEGVSSFYRFLILLAAFMAALVLAAFLLWMMFCYFFNHALWVQIINTLAEIWGFVKVLAIVVAGITVFWLGGNAVVSVLAKMPRQESITFDEKENLVLSGLFGARQFSFQKTTIADRKTTKGKLGTTKIELVPPSIPVQIREGLFSVGMAADMLIYGFEKGTMQPIRLQRPYSSLTIGGTGSGKTRANAWRTLQRLGIETPGGFNRVTICDPHYFKPDGLTKLMEPVEGWVKIARNPREIYLAAKEFYEEMERRKSGTSKEMMKPGVFIPRHIIFDEWAEIMDDTQPKYPYTDEERQLILALAIGCVHAYRGFGGFVHLAMQNPKQSNIGDISLRDDMPLLLVHKVSENVASFLYPSSIEGEKRKAVLKLRGRQCYTDCRTEEVQFVTEMCDVVDDAAELYRDTLIEAGIQPLFSPNPAPKQIAAPAPANAPAEDSGTARRLEEMAAMLQALMEQKNRTITRPLPSVEPRAYHYSLPGIPSPDEVESGRKNPDTGPLPAPGGESVKDVKEPGEPGEESEAITETGEDGEFEGVIPAAEQELLTRAVIEVFKRGKPVRRADIMAYLRNEVPVAEGGGKRWNNKKWPMIKRFCDLYNIAAS